MVKGGRERKRGIEQGVDEGGGRRIIRSVAEEEGEEERVMIA